MVLAKYQHMSILELILLVKQHILISCKKFAVVAVLIIVNQILAISHTITQSIVAQDQFKQPKLSSQVLCTEIHIHLGNMSSLVGNIVSNKCCLNLEAICMSRHIGNKNHRQFCMVYTSLMYFKRRKLRLFPYIFSSQEGQ